MPKKNNESYVLLLLDRWKLMTINFFFFLFLYRSAQYWSCGDVLYFKDLSTILCCRYITAYNKNISDRDLYNLEFKQINSLV